MLPCWLSGYQQYEVTYGPRGYYEGEVGTVVLLSLDEKHAMELFFAWCKTTNNNYEIRRMHLLNAEDTMVNVLIDLKLMGLRIHPDNVEAVLRQSNPVVTTKENADDHEDD